MQGYLGGGDIRKWASEWGEWNEEGRRASEIHVEQVTAVCVGGLAPAGNPLRNHLECISELFFRGARLDSYPSTLKPHLAEGCPWGCRLSQASQTTASSCVGALSQHSWQDWVLEVMLPTDQGAAHCSRSWDTGWAAEMGHRKKRAAIRSKSMISVLYKRPRAPSTPPSPLHLKF